MSQIAASCSENRPQGLFRLGRKLRSCLSQINPRAAILVGMMLIFLGFPAYESIVATVTGGITHEGGLLVVDIKAMSSFEMDAALGTIQDVPQRYRDLDGKRVMLTGEMWAAQNASGRIAAFDLVYSIGNCCFAGPPRVQHFVHAKVTNGRSVQYHSGLVKVTGILHVAVEKAQGRVVSVYRLDVEKLEPV